MYKRQGLHRTAQRTLVAGVRHRAGHRRQRLGAPDQAFVLLVSAFGHDCGCFHGEWVDGRGSDDAGGVIHADDDEHRCGLDEGDGEDVLVGLLVRCLLYTSRCV